MLKCFAEKMWVAFHIFSEKNIRILYIEPAKAVNEMTLNELVKLTMLWTTGHRSVRTPTLSDKWLIFSLIISKVSNKSLSEQQKTDQTAHWLIWIFVI